MVTITQLKYLLAVEKTRHFGEAAKVCHVSQPSLSAQIQKLEHQLDVIVFDRTHKPVLVTEVGKLILNQARRVLREHGRIQEIADRSQEEVQGVFHLAVIPTLATDLLPLFVGEFARAYPRVQLKVHEHKTTDIIALLLADELDAGLLVTPLGDDRMIERHLFYEPFYAYISQGHKLGEKKFVKEQDLNRRDLWLLEEGHCFRNQVLNVCRMGRHPAGLNNLEFESGNLETLKNLVKRNSGYTLLPELALTEMSDQEKSEHVRKFHKPVPTREVSLVHSRSFLKERIIDAIEQKIIAHLPREIRSLKRGDVDVINI